MPTTLLTQFLSDYGITQAPWILTIEVFCVVLLTFLTSFIANRFLNRLSKRLRTTRTRWDDAAFYAVHKPAKAFIWLFGLSLAALTANQIAAFDIASLVKSVRELGLIALLTWAMVRFVSAAENLLTTADPNRNSDSDVKPLDQTTASAISKLVKGSVLITATLMVLQNLGYSISGVLAFGGVGGIAIGFAAKDLLANFFGGLMIYLDRPFNVGDWIRSPDKDIEGTVEKIGWRLTTVRTFEKRPLYIPNAVFANIAVENPSRMSHRRINETIGIRYDDLSHMQSIVQEVEAMLRKHPEIDSDQTLMVHFNQFNASSLDFFIYAMTPTTNWIRFHALKQDVLLQVSAIIARHGAEIAFPTQTLHIPGATTAQPESVRP
jgi:MscS family membrane protein